MPASKQKYCIWFCYILIKHKSQVLKRTEFKRDGALFCDINGMKCNKQTKNCSMLWYRNRIRILSAIVNYYTYVPNKAQRICLFVLLVEFVVVAVCSIFFGVVGNCWRFFGVPVVFFVVVALSEWKILNFILEIWCVCNGMLYIQST